MLQRPVYRCFLLLLPAEHLTKGPVAFFCHLFKMTDKGAAWALKPPCAKSGVSKPASRQAGKGGYRANHLELSFFLPSYS